MERRREREREREREGKRERCWAGEKVKDRDKGEWEKIYKS